MSKNKTNSQAEATETPAQSTVTFKVVAEGGVFVRSIGSFSSEPLKTLEHGTVFEAITDDADFVELVEGGYVYNAPYTIERQ